MCDRNHKMSFLIKCRERIRLLLYCVPCASMRRYYQPALSDLFLNHMVINMKHTVEAKNFMFSCFCMVS